MTGRTAYDRLRSRLNAYVRKHYWSTLIRGALKLLIAAIAFYLLVTALEAAGWLFLELEVFFFYAGVLGGLVGLVTWVIWPMTALVGLRKGMGVEEAARNIGRAIPDIDDKLLNVIQLERMSVVQDEALLLAGIEQKMAELNPFSFVRAVSLRVHLKRAKYATVLVALVTGAWILFPGMMRESNQRIVEAGLRGNASQALQFEVLNKDLRAREFSNFVLQAKATGNWIPEQAWIRHSGVRFAMEAKGNGVFEYVFRKVGDDIDFKIETGDQSSNGWKLEVVRIPRVVEMEMHMKYPPYIGRKDELRKNVGDVVVPEGTVVHWKVQTANSAAVSIWHPEDGIVLNQLGRDSYDGERRILNDWPYVLLLKGKNDINGDSVNYQIGVVRDRYPEIRVNEVEDSLNDRFRFYIGSARDDYGIRKVEMTFEGAQKSGTIDIPVMGKGKEVEFTWSWNLDELNLEEGEEVSYYFVVWDNDGVNGTKSSRSQTMTFRNATKSEKRKEADDLRSDVKKDMEEYRKEAAEMQRELENLRNRLMEKKETSWEDKKAMEDLLKKNQELRKNVEKLKKDMSKSLEKDKNNSPDKERLEEKRKRLEELFEELLDDETRKMMEELERLMEELKPEEQFHELEDVEMSNDELETELDRMLELFKKLELEQKMEEALEDLRKLAEEQEALAESDKDAEELAKEQEELTKKFEELAKDLDEIDKLNEDLESPKPLEEMEESEESIRSEMKGSESDLQKGNKSKGQKKQKKAGEMMKEMADKMAASMSQMEMEQAEQDMKAIRQLLENLIKLSFEEEALMEEFQGINTKAPKFLTLVQRQHRLREDIQMVEDSVTALAKRVPQISSFVNAELAQIRMNLKQGIGALEERNVPQGRSRQQFVMMGLNNLALMLDEALQQMQQQMANQMSGNQMCQKPGSGKSLKSLGQMQQQLNEQISKMKGELQKGNGKQKPGMSKELAKMAAEQAALRRALEELSNSSDGNGSSGELKEILEEMERTEEDLVNKRLDEELLERQNDILIRLLEADKAKRERDKSEERESESGKDQTKKIPPEIEEYLRNREKEVIMYQTVPLELKPFYREAVEQYFESVKGSKE